MAEVGLPTTQPILEAADEDSPKYRADRACLARKVKKLKRQRTRSLIHGRDSGSADRPAHSWGDQWRRHSGTVGARGPLWIGRTSLPTLPGRWIKSCWRGTNIWPRKTAS